ncbi:hypothetical protein PF005_g27076 [Phytophthora fragariae]|uniref:Uncharacterized protein n=1 Tax=Phytophthora fragariae TaxID=53985 RepID=A0A6A3VUM3_9STRA|nr:hypothetical protein PF009_g29159 [Phytophthora fragariae]KAE9066191.1 hypothetical protein PF007_g28568 [Phytophthora fragariae]KAE9067760.1 hypothetical protein PF010_g27339 [Phytophthora fragariae]KAE9171599.1 hypothetical protein PF005_g27076 [Phytophthora fragariae]KAE9173792.1 hypothetical protein PF002_g29224 [Phytophthora fragariae]
MEPQNASPLPSSPSMADVHAAWLAAGAHGDTGTMRELWSRFPKWLDFNRQVGHAKSDSLSQRQARFCSWGDFHLRTIGASALHTASWGGNVAIVEFLLESGQDPNASDDSGMTAIMVAILRLNLMTMRCVFRGGEAVRRNTVVDCRQEQDEQVQHPRTDGKTALHCSTSDDAYDVAKFLLDAGANIDALDESGKTPLHYCVQEGGLLVTDLLLSRGASIDAEDKDGFSPLALVLQWGNVSLLQLFLNHHQCVATPERQDFSGAVLLQAVDYRAEEAVRYIVENEYASVAVCNAWGETPMHLAIKQRNPPLMELLNDLDPAGVSLVAVTADFETPAHYAARYGSHREVEILLRCLTSTFGDLQELDAASLLNAVNVKGVTALYIAGTTATEFDREKAVKVRVLMEHEARLFPAGFLATELTSAGSRTASRVLLPARVQQCLRAWIVEHRSRTDEPEDEEAAHAVDEHDLVEAVAELCMRWMAGVACIGSWTALLPIVICAGYAHDVVPLLVELPLQRRALPDLLRQLEKFARHRLCHALLLQLHNELLEAYQEIATRRT